MSNNDRQAHGLMLETFTKDREDMVEAANKLRSRPEVRSQLDLYAARKDAETAASVCRRVMTGYIAALTVLVAALAACVLR